MGDKGKPVDVIFDEDTLYCIGPQGIVIVCDYIDGGQFVIPWDKIIPIASDDESVSEYKDLQDAKDVFDEWFDLWKPK